jgi:hypothetical protein
MKIEKISQKYGSNERHLKITLFNTPTIKQVIGEGQICLN